MYSYVVFGHLLLSVLSAYSVFVFYKFTKKYFVVRELKHFVNMGLIFSVYELSEALEKTGIIPPGWNFAFHVIFAAYIFIFLYDFLNRLDKIEQEMRVISENLWRFYSEDDAEHKKLERDA